ncbi:hypothetical protein [Photorhabdus stackebrandtii]|uniref:Uncharacterized protein n=1 Tax=Photorhabdus stackebrandtii TaxID=1123042 RepID=A0A7X5QJT2_9GAMM|nr:hypothetical protein [Photorhabdus stackebrandtii]NHB95591.1 hypothetical protein [Photorhabdus stackebrandtii]
MKPSGHFNIFINEGLVITAAIEKNKLFFEDEVLSSLKYLSENFNIAFSGKLNINYNWKVFANYFLCVDAIKEQDQKNAVIFLKSALDNLSAHNPKMTVLSRPGILVITDANISEEVAKTLKDIYDKPDNDVNDDGVYAFGPFTGNSVEEITKNETYDIIEQYGDLTERGYEIFKEMKERVDQCLK